MNELNTIPGPREEGCGAGRRCATAASAASPEAPGALESPPASIPEPPLLDAPSASWEQTNNSYRITETKAINNYKRKTIYSKSYVKVLHTPFLISLMLGSSLNTIWNLEYKERNLK